MSIDAALSEPKVRDVLDCWTSARMHEAPAFSGGVVDAWPALMVDGLAVCRAEEDAIDDWRRHLEREPEANRG